MRFLEAPKDLGKMFQTAKSTEKRSSFISLSFPSCGPRPEKIKTIGHAITCHILIISWNPNTSHSMTWAKTYIKRSKRQGILKIELFPG